MSIDHNRIKVADLEKNQPNKILITNSNGELEFSDVDNLEITSPTFAGVVTSPSFKTTDGTSSQFLKADGSVDSNVYTTATNLANYLPLSGGIMDGKITFQTADINNGFYWDVNSDIAGITFKNTGDGDQNSYINFFTGDNGNEYFKFSTIEWNNGPKDWADIKDGNAYFNGNLYVNAVQTGDFSSKTNYLSGGDLVWHTGNFNPYTTKVSYADNIDNQGTVMLGSPTDSNSIYITQPSYSVDQPVKLLNFDWRSRIWSIGNVRSGDDNSEGFGTFFNGVEKSRITPSGNVLINTKTDNGVDKLQVNGSAKVIGLGINGGIQDGFVLDISGDTVLRGKILLNGEIGDFVNNNFKINNVGSSYLNAYHGNLLVSTIVDNGVDRLQVNGTISASPATTSTQVVVKSQLDAVDDNAIHKTGNELVYGDKRFKNPIVVNMEDSEFKTTLSDNRLVFENFGSGTSVTNIISSDPDGEVTLTLPNETGTLVLKEQVSLSNIDEGNGVGFAPNRTAANYGNIGAGSLDLTLSESASSTLGVTNDYSLGYGDTNTISGYASIGGGTLNTLQADYSSGFGINNQTGAGSQAVSVNGVGNSVTGLGITVVGQAANIINSTTLDFNADLNKPLFVVGNGTITNNDPNYSVTSRSDALVVRNNGDVEIGRDLKLHVDGIDQLEAKIQLGNDSYLSTDHEGYINIHSSNGFNIHTPEEINMDSPVRIGFTNNGNTSFFDDQNNLSLSRNLQFNIDDTDHTSTEINFGNNCWINSDNDGHIYTHSTNTTSICSDDDISLSAPNGIFTYSDINMPYGKQIKFGDSNDGANASISTYGDGDMLIRNPNLNVDITSMATTISTQDSFNIVTQGNIFIVASAEVSFQSVSNVITYINNSPKLNVTENYVKSTVPLQLPINTAPTSATSVGTMGEIRFTSTGIYICIATNNWIKCIGSTF